MKKHIIFAAALTVICLNNLFAQGNEQVNATVARNFEKKFSGASYLQWQPQLKGISLARFRFENETWVAYYSHEGNLIASGRKVKSPDQLPIKVRESLEGLRSKFEAKFGTLQFGGIYEIASDNGTAYYIPLENQQLSMMVSIDDNGFSAIERKVKHSSPIATHDSAIAKKN